MEKFNPMTIKIQAYQANGIKTDKLIDEYEFCCWEALYKWLEGFSSLHKCPKCKENHINLVKPGRVGQS
ncbi:MAG: hypothetical protein IMZ60_02545 [Actinobacteria bacterium]|nr:hypothetical protein [Actinomycetota bacterium]